MRILILCLLLATPLLAQPELTLPAGDYLDVPSLVTAVDTQYRSIIDYSMVVYTRLHQREWVIDYRCVRPSEIRTEILDGAYRSIVMRYGPQEPDQIAVRVGHRIIRRDVKQLKLTGTPMVQSVMDRLLEDLHHGTFQLTPHRRVRIEVGRSLELLETNDDPLDDREIREAVPSQPATQIEHRLLDRDCYVLTAEHEEIALDRHTLWPLSIQKGDSTAEVWDMRVNTSPSLDL